MKLYEHYLIESGILSIDEIVGRSEPICDIVDITGKERPDLCSKINMSMGQEVADKYGLKFNGYSIVRGHGGWWFTDISKTHTTFFVEDLEDIEEKLKEIKNKSFKVAA